jgi:hypothetical protein
MQPQSAAAQRSTRESKATGDAERKDGHDGEAECQTTDHEHHPVGGLARESLG